MPARNQYEVDKTLVADRRCSSATSIALLGVGHRQYWGQFEGLKGKLTAKLDRFAQKVTREDVSVTNFGLIDESASAYAAIPRILAYNPDMVFVDMLTYATSATFAPLVQQLHLPFVLFALQPDEALDYAHGNIFTQLTNDDICSLPEFVGVAIRMGRAAPPFVIGMLDGDPRADAEIDRWCRIAGVVHELKSARIGLMGHVLEAMYDMHTDPSLITRTFGCHVVQAEPDEILRHYQDVSDGEIQEMSGRILSFFDTPDPVSDPVTTKLTDHDLAVAAKAAVALNKFVEEQNLTGLAYYYEAGAGTEMRELVTNLIVGNSLLCAEGFPMCGEFDLKTCIGMLIMDRLGIGGSFAEFHPVDFVQETVLVGHDGPHHIAIAAERPVLRSLSTYHGKPGAGASVEFRIKEGPITMLSVSVNEGGRLKFILAEGESIAGPIPPTGNTNTHGKFGPDVRTFLSRWIAEGPTHHFSLGIGHHAKSISDIARLFDIECVTVSTESRATSQVAGENERGGELQ